MLIFAVLYSTAEELKDGPIPTALLRLTKYKTESSSTMPHWKRDKNISTLTLENREQNFDVDMGDKKRCRDKNRLALNFHVLSVQATYQIFRILKPNAQYRSIPCWVTTNTRRDIWYDIHNQKIQSSRLRNSLGNFTKFGKE